MTNLDQQIKVLQERDETLSSQWVKIRELEGAGSKSEKEAWRAVMENVKQLDPLLVQQMNRDWPVSFLNIRIIQALRRKGYKTFSEIVELYDLHGIFWFGQFKNLGPKYLKQLEEYIVAHRGEYD